VHWFFWIDPFTITAVLHSSRTFVSGNNIPFQIKWFRRTIKCLFFCKIFFHSQKFRMHVGPQLSWLVKGSMCNTMFLNDIKWCLIILCFYRFRLSENFHTGIIVYCYMIRCVHILCHTRALLSHISYLMTNDPINSFHSKIRTRKSKKIVISRMITNLEYVKITKRLLVEIFRIKLITIYIFFSDRVKSLAEINCRCFWKEYYDSLVTIVKLPKTDIIQR
jgi:hypothetical protein